MMKSRFFSLSSLLITSLIWSGCKDKVTPITPPVVVTGEVSEVTTSSAVIISNVSTDGGVAVTERGVCWSLANNPTIADSKTSDGSGIGTFTSTVSNLAASTTYFFRAYAMNAKGTSYGNQVEVRTLSTVPMNGLIGYWPFNGNAKDESGNGNDGVNTNAAPASDRFGKPSSAFEFDGASSVIKTTKAINNITKITLSFWFKTTEGGPILWQGNNLGGFSAAIHSAATGGEGVYKGRGIFYIDRPGSAFGKMTQQVYNDGVWHNYTAVLDGYATTEVPASLMKIFIDGVYVPQDEILMNQSSVSLPASPDFPFWFGKAAVDYTFYFKGVLDDIAIWNRPLSSDEIQKIYNGDGF